MSLKDKYAIVGVGYTPQGRVPDRTTLSFHVEASVNAIKDAGLKREDIDGLISYRHLPAAIGEPDMTPYLLAQHLGITPKVMSQEANCARSQVLNALGWLDAGLCNYVVISYAHNALSGSSFFGQGIDNYNSAVFGHFGATAGYAMAAQRAMHTFGTGPETWKHIAVGQRKWANLNPSAMMHDRPMSVDDYYDSQWVVEPLRLFDNCLITDGGRACVITSVDRARDLRNPPAVIMGIGQHNPSYEIDQATTMAGPTGAKISGEQAFEDVGQRVSFGCIQIKDS